MEANNTATNRQRYALFCITKKDYGHAQFLSVYTAYSILPELGTRQHALPRQHDNVKT